jgi:predicted phage gp36 major capsid-like protein
MADRKKLKEHYRIWATKQRPKELKRKNDQNSSTLTAKRNKNTADKENVDSNTVDSNLSDEDNDSAKSSSSGTQSGTQIRFTRGNISIYIQKGKSAHSYYKSVS